MPTRFLFSFIFFLFLSACGGGSSSSGEGENNSNAFKGEQTITLTNGSTSATEKDDFIATLEGNIVTIVDENFSAKGELNANNQFTVSSPMFSTTSSGTTCTGSVDYIGEINANIIFGSIKGEFTCSEIVFDVSGEFSGSN